MSLLDRVSIARLCKAIGAEMAAKVESFATRYLLGYTESASMRLDSPGFSLNCEHEQVANIEARLKLALMADVVVVDPPANPFRRAWLNATWRVRRLLLHWR